MATSISSIFLDFDNIYGALFSESPALAVVFATNPAEWVDSLSHMHNPSGDETIHNFIIRRCYMNPSGKIANNEPFSRFRQNFVRDGWEVIDTPPLTSRGKTSADTHIVMDVMDSITDFPRVECYIIMAADADYTPLVIRLRKHLKTTIVYAAPSTSGAYKAACDSIIEQKTMIEILKIIVNPDIDTDNQQPSDIKIDITDIKIVTDRYFNESNEGHEIDVSSLILKVRQTYPNFEFTEFGFNSISQLFRNGCSLEVYKNAESRTMVRRSASIAQI
jgi:NYN domain